MVGRKVLVMGHGPGTLQYYGRHATKPGFRCGVELQTAGAGKHDGTVAGYYYFVCPQGAGILVDPRKVSLAGMAPAKVVGGGGCKPTPSRVRPARAMVGDIRPKPGEDAKVAQATYLKAQLEKAPEVYASVYKRKPRATYEASNAAKGKNRYGDITPYDDTRVVLDEVGDCEYINANYVDAASHSSDLQHICCQGPTKNTVEDMWSMVWQEEVEVIVMLAQVFEGTPPRLKCEHYWPEKPGTAIKYGDVTVKAKKPSTKGSLVTTELQVTHASGGSARKVKHLQFLAWPDHGCPNSPEEFIALLEAFKKLVAGSSPNAGRPIVHCSAGVGRTGVLIFVRILEDKLRQGLVPDLKAVLTELRDQRCTLVQTLVQFEFAIKTALYLVGGADMLGSLDGDDAYDV